MTDKSAPYETFENFKKNFKSKTVGTGILLLLFSLCTLSIIVGMFVIQKETESIVKNKLETLKLMISRNKLYIDLEINLSKAYFQEIGSWDGSMEEDEL